MIMRMGWLRDYEDIRDLPIRSGLMRSVLEQPRFKESSDRADLRKFCTPVEDQGDLGSCTANAAAGLIEYFERKAFRTWAHASRLFIYKTTRNLMKITGDGGAYLRTTLKALAHFGVPPEDYFPYDVKKFDQEPSAFLYAYAQAYQALEYYRVDTPGRSPEDVLKDLRRLLSGGVPFVFGFMVYASIEEADKDGKIPFPDSRDRLAGGHAVMAAGFDDGMKIGKTRGAILIRNSWGSGWGDKGYGWLPYEYVIKGLASDHWTLMKQKYIDASLFEGEE